jgi:hypothetical protein
VDSAIEWQRVREFLLSTVSKQTTDDKMDTLATYGKTVPAMVYEMQRLYERLTTPVVDPSPDAAPRHGLSIQQLEAYAAKAGVSKRIIDTGANASMCAPGTPLGDTKPAAALVTGATAAAPTAATEVGSLTVICDHVSFRNGPVHLSSEKMHVLSTLPPGLILFSFDELVQNGWRFVQKTSGEMFLQSSPTADHNRRKIPLSMDGGVLSIANVSAVVPGVIPQPSGFEGTSLYVVGLEASEQELVTNPHPVLNSYFVHTVGHDKLTRALPEDKEALMSSRKHQHRCGRAIQRSQLSANGRSAAGSDPLEKNHAKRAAKKAERAKQRAESEQDFTGLPEQYDRAADLAVDPPVNAPEATLVPSQPMLAAERAAKEANHMQTCDVNQVSVRSVTSSADAVDAQVLRNSISPTEIALKGACPECMMTPNIAERLVPASNVAVTAVHPSPSGNSGLLVRLLAAHDGPNECAAAHASCCIPQRVRHYATLDVAPVPVSLMDTSVPPGPPAMKATVRYEPSDRYFSAAAIDFAVTDSADEAVAEVKSVNDLTLASHLSAVDHELALYEYGPAAAAVVDPIHSEHADDDRCTVVQPSKRFRPDVQRFAPALRDHADAGMTESMAVDAAVVEPIPNEHADFSDPRFKRSTVTVKVVHERNSNPADDVTIDGGVKSTNVNGLCCRPRSDSTQCCPRLSPRRSLLPAVGL